SSSAKSRHLPAKQLARLERERRGSISPDQCVPQGRRFLDRRGAPGCRHFDYRYSGEEQRHPHLRHETGRLRPEHQHASTRAFSGPLRPHDCATDRDRCRSGQGGVSKRHTWPASAAGRTGQAAFDQGVGLMREEEEMANEQSMEVQKKREAQTQGEKTVPARFYMPPTDIYETEDALTLVMEMPGVDREDVTVNL